MPIYRFLALGDSYTIGESVSAEERWLDQLAKRLESNHIQTEVKIIARTGWTTSELWQGIQNSDIRPPYDFVSLLIGVNNQYRREDIDEYRDQFSFLLKKSTEYAGGNANRVMVLSLPDWGMTPLTASHNRAWITKEIDEFNSVNRELSEGAGVHYVDVTSTSREAVRNATLIAPDGLHPSGKMYVLWVEKILPIVKEILISSNKEKR